MLPTSREGFETLASLLVHLNAMRLENQKTSATRELKRIVDERKVV